ncbi:MAG: protein kinase [Pirellulales bacterium]|nr:protein kinase [Pirellulales bacterium]
MDYSSITDLSMEPAVTRDLSDAQKERLALLLDRYLSALEEGAPPSIEELVREEAELAEPLRTYIAGLEDLHQIAVGFVPQVDSEQVDSERAISEQGGGNGGHSAGDPRRLGDFELLEEIGRGGMGVVYRARQISLNRTVAIKLLPFAAVLNARQIARFKNEAQAAAQLHHPNIVPVFNVGSERGVHYYTMQFIDGQSLDDLIEQQKSEGVRPDLAATITAGIEAAEALHTAHQFGVVHRDIKPSNLILDREGKLWVTDFGLARCQRDVTLTKTGDVVGTMRYMSPEQARGEAAIVDGRTDVYSLGATLYEMLCLEPAFQGGDAPGILRNIDERSAKPLRSLRGDLPRDLETVIAKAMSKTRDGRYETAAEFAEDLRRILAGKPTVARPPTIIDRTAQWAMKHRNAVAVTLGVGLLMLFGFAISTAMIAAEKQVSDANALRATRERNLARGAVDRLGAQMAELLADVPAADSVRRQLLQETLAYYQEFAEQADDDPELLEDLAVTYGKIGTLQNQIGSQQQAVDSLQKSTDLFLDLAAADRSDPSIRQRLATSQNNLALALQEVGRVDDASRWYKKTIALQRDLLKKMPRNAELQADLALSLNNFALLLSKVGQVEAAQDSFQRAIETLDSVDEKQMTGEIERQLASTYNNLGGTLAKADPQRAAKYAQLALQIQMQQLLADRSNPKAASRVAATLNSLGTAQAELGATQEAVESYNQAIEIQDQLVQRWPSQQVHQRDIAVTYNNLGLTLAKQNQLEEAREVFGKALHFQAAVCETFAGDADLQSTLGGIYNNLAFVQERLALQTEAIDSYRSAVEHQSKAHTAAPQVARYRLFLSKHFFNYARMLRKSGRPEEAVKITLKRRELWKNDGDRLASVAKELRATANEMPTEESSPAVISQHDCVDYARETLQMALEAGYTPPPDLLDRPEYHSLRRSEQANGT